MHKIKTQYQNLVGLLFLTGGGSLSSLARLFGKNNSAWRSWKTELPKDCIFSKGNSKKSRKWLRDTELFYKLLYDFLNEYLGFSINERKLKKIREVLNLNKWKISDELRPEIKYYKNVYFAIYKHIHEKYIEE